MARPTIYDQLAERIRQEIMSYRDGWEIPSVRSLARRYDVATNTIRKALSFLAEQNEIALPGPSAQYVRRQNRAHRSFCKPYPAVGLLCSSFQNLAGEDYLPMLVGSFITALRDYLVPTIVLPPPQHLDMDMIVGGMAIRTPHCRFSAATFLLGAEESMLTAIVKTGAVVMTLDFLSDVEGVDSVAVDCQKEAEIAVEYLARLRHQEIAFLAALSVFSPSHWHEDIDPDALRFSQAVLEAKRRTGLNADPAYHVHHKTDLARSDTGARAALDKLWRLSPPPTSLICFDPITAEQARLALEERGIRCPENVSILTRDCARDTPSPFTQLVTDARQIGSAAAAQVLTRLTNPTSLPARLQFPSLLMEGRTSGRAQSRS